ncbi:MAG: hypothetical protein R3E09_04380 [Novosphingobium sp.]|nr:hypothetical protein [Novosphingobium sp.]
MNMRLALAAASAPFALAGCTQEPPQRPPVSPAAKVVGEPRSCIPITQISSTRIRDDWTIDFIGTGSKVWRNTLPHRCNSLKSEDAFTYETSLSQLCNTDIIYVLQRVGGDLQRGAGCGLGKFVPVKLEKK